MSYFPFTCFKKSLNLSLSAHINFLSLSVRMWASPGGRPARPPAEEDSGRCSLPTEEDSGRSSLQKGGVALAVLAAERPERTRLWLRSDWTPLGVNRRSLLRGVRTKYNTNNYNL